MNLLPVLDAVLRHRNATLAAADLGMSQSALSSALGRLRLLLNDELFIRTGHGLSPTARAQALAAPVAQVMAQVRDTILQPGSFEPSMVDREFCLNLSDVGGYVLWPRLVHAVQAAAPGVTLRLKTLPEPEINRAFEQGQIDLAIGVYPSLPETLFQRRVYERVYVGIARVGHPLAGRSSSLAGFAEAPQIAVHTSSRIQQQIEALLQARGLRRKRVIELPSYLMLLPMLLSGDYLAVVPAQYLETFDDTPALTAVELPFSLPTSTVRVHWHRRSHDEVGNQWLRRLIIAVLTDEKPGAGSGA
ncbi:MAG: LysR family transcriptional regulator [Pigmentiphaga sp.]